MTALFKNNAFSTLASGINDSVTSISLENSELLLSKSVALILNVYVVFGVKYSIVTQ